MLTKLACCVCAACPSNIINYVCKVFNVADNKFTFIGRYFVILFFFLLISIVSDFVLQKLANFVLILQCWYYTSTTLLLYFLFLSAQIEKMTEARLCMWSASNVVRLNIKNFCQVITLSVKF